MAGLSALFYLTPESYSSTYGARTLAAQHFRGFYGFPGSELLLSNYLVLFLGSLITIWSGYLLGIFSLLYERKCLNAKSSGESSRILLSVVFILMFAIFTPPILSSDVYAYLGYARMILVHEINPYSNPQSTLLNLNDPVAPFLMWDVVSPYGAIWTFVSTIITAPLIRFDIFFQIVAFKLLAAASLFVIAFQASHLARNVSSDFSRVTFFAVLFNPLFVIEGPGMGHNDFFFVALIISAARLWQDRRYSLAAIVLGVSGGIKFFSLAAVPWLLIELVRREKVTKFGKLTLLVASAIAPLVIGDLLLYALTETTSFFNGLFAHIPNLLLHSAQGKDTEWAVKAAVIFTSYLCLTAILIARPDFISWVFCLAILAFLIKTVFHLQWPWYLVWVLGLSLHRWDRIGLFFSSLLMGVAILSSFLYVTTWTLY